MSLFNSRLLTLTFCITSLFACSHSSDEDETLGANPSLEKVVASKHRLPENIVRDEHRNPLETLQFFDVRPQHTVIEVSPGGGWYTEILAPYLRDRGNLILAIFSEQTESDYRRNINRVLKEKIEKGPEIYRNVSFTVFEPPNFMDPLAPSGTVDRILTFRNVHNWMRQGKAEEVFEVFYDALKPGGVLGLVQHRAAHGKEEQDLEAASGYVSQDYVIAMAKKAGFELAQTSEVNANPKDTADHPRGVWTLPPGLRMGDEDKKKYQAIGESDRMTLKLVKQ